MSEKSKKPKTKKVKKLKKIKLNIKTPVDDKKKSLPKESKELNKSNENPLEEEIDDEIPWISEEGVIKDMDDDNEEDEIELSEVNVITDDDDSEEESELLNDDEYQEQLKKKTKKMIEKIKMGETKSTDDLPENLTKYVSDVSQDDSDSGSDSDSDDELRKIDNELYNNILMEYHPELQENNYKEILSYSNVSRNKLGQIIDPLHTTLPFLTKFEKAKILGLRSKQINKGSRPFIEVSSDIINSYIIAEMELKEKAIPFIIKRPMPNGGCEFWKIQDLELLD